MLHPCRKTKRTNFTNSGSNFYGFCHAWSVCSFVYFRFDPFNIVRYDDFLERSAVAKSSDTNRSKVVPLFQMVVSVFWILAHLQPITFKSVLTSVLGQLVEKKDQNLMSLNQMKQPTFENHILDSLHKHQQSVVILHYLRLCVTTLLQAPSRHIACTFCTIVGPLGPR